MEAFFVCGIVFYFIYKIIELFVRQKERRLMIEKMSQVPSEMLQSNISSLQIAQNNYATSNKFTSLRLGGLLLGTGSGWLIGWLLYWNFRIYLENINLKFWNSDLQSVIYASVALCAGIGLIIVYLIERKALKEAKKAE